MKYIEVSPRSLVIFGKYMYPLTGNVETDREIWRKVLGNLEVFMDEKEYLLSRKEAIDRVFVYRYGEYDFWYRMAYAPEYTLLDKILKFFLGESEAKRRAYFRGLKNTRRSIPWRVIVYWKITEAKEIGAKYGIQFEIYSHPTIYYQADQLGIPLILSFTEYDRIIHENIMFVKSIGEAIHAIEISPPRPLRPKGLHRITPNMLRRFGFEESAELLESAYEKISVGLLDDGLTDLKESISKFGEKLCGTRKVGEILRTLLYAGLLSQNAYRVLDLVVRRALYGESGSTGVHERPKVNQMFDVLNCKYAYNITCSSFEYILSKIRVYGRKDFSAALEKVRSEEKQPKKRK